uniref:tRNA (guanine(37)-N1)-methyltransferase n=1 Tax=Rhodosorus marinus TaxID=101924 RepID=A0A7S0G4G3_9RHOD|mmetsp:Transcript_18185/g.26335  ORF Transcript_18185/g.26335 Transcript_18185/m.26335 type:complete len:399 (+) Transcript_18185:125-1321(+)
MRMGSPRSWTYGFVRTVHVSRASMAEEKRAAVNEIDKRTFVLRVKTHAVRVQPKLTETARLLLDPELLRVPKLRYLVKRTESSFLLLLKYVNSIEGDPSLPLGNVVLAGEKTKEQVLASLRQTVEEQKHSIKKRITELPESALNAVSSLTVEDLDEHEIEVGYDYWNWSVVLKKSLPDEFLCPSSYEQVGHIIHLNLRDDQLPHRYLIGNVLMEKIKGTRTVVNKVEPTGGAFRLFQMERLAGEDDFLAQVKENGCVYEMDFSKLYWNSRLEGEHRRIVEMLTEKDILADAFAGVGPFVIPAAKLKNVKSYGNDLNPASVDYMKRNVLRNKVTKLVETSCSDARSFLLDLIDRSIPFTHVVMNFPSGASEFLDLFRGAYRQQKELPLPMVCSETEIKL